MSKLGNKQRRLVRMLPELIDFAHQEGFELTLGDAFRDPRCSYGAQNSLHRSRLAIDFNLFRNGIWLRQTKDFESLGIFWEALGGAWGGRFQDGNHFSLEHEGRK